MIVIVEPDNSSSDTFAVRAALERRVTSAADNHRSPNVGVLDKNRTIRPRDIYTAIPRWTARCRRTTPASSSNQALISG